MIVGDGELFFTFLVFVSRITDAIAPFLTAVFDPTPSSREASSWMVIQTPIRFRSSKNIHLTAS
jgi:hypothetical protein